MSHEQPDVASHVASHVASPGARKRATAIAIQLSISYLKNSITGGMTERAEEEVVQARGLLKEARGVYVTNGGELHATLPVHQKLPKKRVPETLITPGCAGVHRKVATLDLHQCYRRWFIYMGYEPLAALFKDPVATLKAAGAPENILEALRTPEGLKEWYTVLSGKMCRVKTLRAFTTLARVRNAMYVTRVIQLLLDEYKHLVFLSAATDSITLKGFRNHAELSELVAKLNSTTWNMGCFLTKGTLEPYLEPHPVGAHLAGMLTMVWSKEIPKRGDGLACGFMATNSNLHIWLHPSTDQWKIVPAHMLGNNLKHATNTVLQLNGKTTEVPINTVELKAALRYVLRHPANECSELLDLVVKRFFPRARKTDYKTANKSGEELVGQKKSPLIYTLIKQAIRGLSSLSSSSSSSSSSLPWAGTTAVPRPFVDPGRYYTKLDDAVEAQKRHGGFVLRRERPGPNRVARDFVLKGSLKDVVGGCYHVYFVGGDLKGTRVYFRPTIDFDLLFPLPQQWLVDIANNLRRFWKEKGGLDVSVHILPSESLRTNEKRFASHVVFRCVCDDPDNSMDLNGKECLFASPEDIVDVFKKMGNIFDIKDHGDHGDQGDQGDQALAARQSFAEKLPGEGPWGAADVFDLQPFNTRGCLRCIGSPKTDQNGFLATHLPANVARKIREKIESGETVNSLEGSWNPSPEEVDRWSAVTNADTLGYYPDTRTVFGTLPSKRTSCAHRFHVLLPSEEIVLRIFEACMYQFLPAAEGWTHSYTPVDFFSPETCPPKATLSIRWISTKGDGEKLDMLEFFTKVLLPYITAVAGGKEQKDAIKDAKKKAAAVKQHSNNSHLNFFYCPAKRIMAWLRGATTWNKGHKKLYKRLGANTQNGAINAWGEELQVLLSLLPSTQHQQAHAKAAKGESDTTYEAERVSKVNTNKPIRFSAREARDVFLMLHGIFCEISSASEPPRKKARLQTTKQTRKHHLESFMLSAENSDRIAIATTLLVKYDGHAAGAIGKLLVVYKDILLKNLNSRMAKTLVRHLENKREEAQRATPEAPPLQLKPALSIGLWKQ